MRQSAYDMTAHDLERIARTALRELGAGDVDVIVQAESGLDRWRITIEGQHSMSMHVRAGEGTSAQFVRDQIFEQFERR
jgi:hypothetical protein